MTDQSGDDKQQRAKSGQSSWRRPLLVALVRELAREVMAFISAKDSWEAVLHTLFSTMHTAAILAADRLLQYQCTMVMTSCGQWSSGTRRRSSGRSKVNGPPPLLAGFQN